MQKLLLKKNNDLWVIIGCVILHYFLFHLIILRLLFWQFIIHFISVRCSACALLHTVNFIDALVRLYSEALFWTFVAESNILWLHLKFKSLEIQVSWMSRYDLIMHPIYFRTFSLCEFFGLLFDWCRFECLLNNIWK